MIGDTQFKNRLSESSNTVFSSTQNTKDIFRGGYNEQTATLLTEALNTMYDLYIQGWTVRDISRRFGILPERAKFHIWCRARLFSEFLPRFGLKFLFEATEREMEAAEAYGTLDYGLDLEDIRNGKRYE